ncbi:hypothetical protein QFC21_001240 [Naganishia friedmannii]|uniref:Uncharacterized protein n=1 Tax=Naganishia friedmannii TaxID=89922 RepID=A0ACC2W451_9TREE|nr:hypothetical protein QFC21_001240 [Naganishia friedmannii]
MGDRAGVYLGGALFDPCTSTIAPTVKPLPTSRPAQVIEPVPTATVISPPLHIEAKMMLWDDHPTRDDMAKMPFEQQSVDNWKEISAVTNAINNIAPWWIPGAVFGSPKDQYRETADKHEKYMGQSKPFVRLDFDPSKAIVPLTLFPGGDHPLTINVTFNTTAIGQGVGWHRAIAAAFDNPGVKERLRSINSSYVLPGDDNNGNKFRTMAIMEMLTGLSVELAEREGSPDVSSNSTVIPSANPGSLTSWLYGNIGTSNDRNPLKWNPTVTFLSTNQLEPILMNTTNNARFSVQDCRAIGPDYFDDFRPDWDLDAYQLFSIFVWSTRLRPADPNFDLNNADYRQMVENRSAQPAYFKYGIPW